MIKGLHHTNIVVSDMEQTKEFYTKILGLEISFETLIEDAEFSRGAGFQDTKVAATFFSVPNSSILIETFQYLTPNGRSIPSDSKANDKGFGHICFEVSDIEQAHRNLREKGVEFASSPVTMDNGVRWCYFYGPDKERLELLELPDSEK